MERFLHKVHLFEGHDSVSMTNEYFWQAVEKPKNVGTAKDKAKEEVPLSDFENRIMENLCMSAENVPWNQEDMLFMDDNDDLDSVASSCAGNERRDKVDINDTEGAEEEEGDGEDSNTKFGNLRKQTFSPLALVDLHSAKNKLRACKSITKKRKTAIDRRGRKLQLMDMAVAFFERKMEMRRKVLIKNIENISTGAYRCQLLPFEMKYKEMMASRRNKK